MGSDAPYYRLAMRAFADFSGTIAIPAVAAAFFGKWLDARFQTAPRYLILCFTVAFALTAMIVIRKAKRYSAEYSKLIDAQK